MGKFSEIAVGGIFFLDGEKFRKTSELTYEDYIGIEHGWSPFLDSRILTDSPPTSQSDAEEPEYLVDPQSRVMRKNPNFGKAKKAPKTTAKKKVSKKKSGRK